MQAIFLCWRYLSKRRIVLFPLAAVMLAVALLIVVSSLFHGFVDSYFTYRARVLGEITFAPPQPWTDYQALAAALTDLPEVAQATPVLESGGLLYLGRGNVRAVKLMGIDLAARAQDEAFRVGLLRQGHFRGLDDRDTGADIEPSFALTDDMRQRARAWLEGQLRRSVREQELPVGAIMGIGVMGRPDELTDEYDRAALLADLAERTVGMSITTGRVGQAADGSREAARRTGAIWPVDIIETGLDEADTGFVYLPFDYLAALVGHTLPDGRVVCEAQIIVTPQGRLPHDEVIARLERFWRERVAGDPAYRATLPGSPIIQSRSQSAWARLFTREIEKQLMILQMILGLICLVVVLLVFVVLYMIVTQKRRDVGIVRSIGGSRTQVAAIFLAYGGFVGVVGAGLGVVLGALATHHIAVLEGGLSRLLGFKIWRSGVYMFREIPNAVAWDAVPMICLAGLLAALLGALLPAWRAARLRPADALRYE